MLSFFNILEEDGDDSNDDVGSDAIETEEGRGTVAQTVDSANS